MIRNILSAMFFKSPALRMQCMLGTLFKIIGFFVFSVVKSPSDLTVFSRKKRTLYLPGTDILIQQPRALCLFINEISSVLQMETILMLMIFATILCYFHSSERKDR